MRGINTILSYYHYRVDKKICKGVCSVCRITYVCPVFVAQIDIDWLPTIATLSQPRYARVENCYYKKML